MEDVMIALVWLGFFATVFLGWYFYLKARNKERMALIERDKDVSEIYSKQEIRFRVPWLKLGLLITGIGFGLAVAIFLISIPAIKDSISFVEEALHYIFNDSFWRFWNYFRALPR
jgi:hypothetical protein